jgi:hypothetical protein
MLVAHSDSPLGARLRGDTTYGPKRVPFQVFLQERLHSVILAHEPFNTIVPEEIQEGRLFEPLFYPSIRMKRILQACDLLKEYYCNTRRVEFLECYKQIRASIPIKPTRFR